MLINSALKKRLNLLLPKDYRRQIVERLKKRGITVHPNTVSNTLNGGDNEEVAAEILQLANERKTVQVNLGKRLRALAQQL